MKYKIKQIGKIKNWDEGLPIGNGDVGALFYGDNNLICSLDKSGLWDNREIPELKEKGFNYKNMVKLVKSKDKKSWMEYLRLFDECYAHTTPTKINAGKLLIDFEINDNCKFELDIKTATLNVQNSNNNMCAFVSKKSFLGYIISTKELNYKVEFPSYFYLPYTNNVLSTQNGLNGLGYEKSFETEKKGIKFFIQKTVYDGYFAIAVKKFYAYNQYILSYSIIKANEEQEIYDKANVIFNIDYQQDYKNHLRCWKKYWNESNIEIPDKKLEKLYYISYYLFSSGNRKGSYPMPLQGVWTKCDGNLPPWKGDYHHDLNTQFTYCSYLKANHIESGKVFIDYLWNNIKIFKDFAKKFYGVNGLLIPAVSSLDGKPLGGWPMYSFSPTMSIWLAKSFDDYYNSTQDLAFLKKKAMPFFEGVINAILQLMVERDGKLFLPLSSSPEYNDCSTDSFFEWSNNDLQLVCYGLNVMVNYCSLVNTDNKKYKLALSKLDNVYTDKCGILFLDNKENYVKESHRHHSNLMCIYPLNTLTAQNGENVKQIENNILHLETLGTGFWVGFSFPWFSCISAMGYLGNRALHYLQLFEKCFVADNGFHLNGDFKNFGVTNFHYRPFTLEANYCFCSAIQEMLLQNHEGFINLFPSIPYEWGKGKIKFNKFLALGCEISARYSDGVVDFFKISSKKELSIKVKNVFGKENLIFSNRQIVNCKQGEIFDLYVDKNGCKLL